MIYEEASVLKDTEFDELYYADYRYWTDTAAEYQRLIEPVLSKVYDSFIEDYDIDGSIITAEYENGIVVTVDMEKRTVDCGDIHIDISEKGGEVGS